jgi:putative photosynthetic complex assembly protein
MRLATANPEQQREIISRRLLRAMGLLVACSLALVTYARLTDRPLEATPVDGQIVRERVVHIVSDNVSGAARVLDESGAMVADLSPTQGGFVAGIWRAVVFERHKAGVDPDAPVRLLRFADGRLALRDEAAGTRFELVGFGADNAAAFARLLDN